MAADDKKSTEDPMSAYRVYYLLGIGNGVKHIRKDCVKESRGVA